MLPQPLDKAVNRYVELEEEIGRLVPPKLTAVCAECGGKCCRAGIANQTIRSWFLREVSRRRHGPQHDTHCNCRREQQPFELLDHAIHMLASHLTE